MNAPPTTLARYRKHRIRILTALLVFAGIGIARPGRSGEVSFDDVLTNPDRFQKQRVTVTGLAEVNGSTFYLWRDTRARRRLDRKHCIWVIPNFSRPNYPGTNFPPDIAANLRPVKIIGTVEARFHGRWGQEPLSLIMERVQILPGPREKSLLPILTWFKNETAAPVTIRIAYGQFDSEFTLYPGDIQDEEEIVRKSTVVARTSSGQLVAEDGLIPRPPGYYDFQRRAYYYRVAHHRIEKVLPDEARRWKFPPTPDRD